MKLLIDNFDQTGVRDYTPLLDNSRMPRVVRKLNKPATCEARLVCDAGAVPVPRTGSRLVLQREDGNIVFSGNLVEEPAPEHLGAGDRGPVLAYELHAISDEYLLDRKPLPRRLPFVNRSAGEILRTLAEDSIPQVYDTNAINDGDRLCSVACDGDRTWSQVAEEVALRTRSTYRVLDRSIQFEPVGTRQHVVESADPMVVPNDLHLERKATRVNDATLLGRMEPGTYVKDYFLGDGYALRFGLSNVPFASWTSTLVEEEFGSEPDQRIWEVSDGAGALSVASGKLQVAGGTGSESDAALLLRESIELGGAWLLQHGEFTITSGTGIAGGLFAETVSEGSCIAGFKIASANGGAQIQALVRGTVVGDPVAVRSGCRYALNTRVYSDEAYRKEQTFYSSKHAAGNGRGGLPVPARLRLVLECREIDPADPGSLARAARVLYDQEIDDTLGFARYAVVASRDMRATVNYTRVRRLVPAVVRSSEPNKPARTRLLGAFAEGGEAAITSDPALYFFSAYPPLPNEAITVSYRTSERASAHASDTVSKAELARELDDGSRGAVCRLDMPPARTSEECVHAVRALLDDSIEIGWVGEYTSWRDLFPGENQDVLPGDSVLVRAPERDAEFEAIVREVKIECLDPRNDGERVHVRFANDAAEPIALRWNQTDEAREIPAWVNEADAAYLPPLKSAGITQITSTSVTIDAGCVAPAGGGIEVRRTDAGWGADDDRNLIGRFTSQIFSVPRWTRNQQFCLRQYDGSTPPVYSRHTTVLYMDYPL